MRSSVGSCQLLEMGWVENVGIGSETLVLSLQWMALHSANTLLLQTHCRSKHITQTSVPFKVSSCEYRFSKPTAIRKRLYGLTRSVRSCKNLDSKILLFLKPKRHLLHLHSIQNKWNHFPTSWPGVHRSQSFDPIVQPFLD